MIVGGQTEARAQLSSTIIDYHEPFDQGLTKIFQSIEFFKFLLQADNELLVPDMQKKFGVTVFVSEIKRGNSMVHFAKNSNF